MKTLEIPTLHLIINKESLKKISPEDKYIDQADLSNPRDYYDGPIAFLTGCFDIFHGGHEIQLGQAKGYVPEGKLVVGINSDMSVKKLKGDSRPINNQNLRLLEVANCPFVDYVFVFDDLTAVPCLERLKPNVFITYNEKLQDKPEIVSLLETLPECVFRINVDCAIDAGGNRISTTSLIASQGLIKV